MYKEIEDLFSVVSLVESPQGGYDIEFEVTDRLKGWFTTRQGASTFDEVFFRKWFQSLFESFMKCRTPQQEAAVVEKFVGLLDFDKEFGGRKRRG